MAKRSELKNVASRNWLWGLVLIVAVILAYIPIWWAGYVWDDDVHLTANPCIIGPLGLKEIWTTRAASICPLTFTTFWLEHKLWGLNPLPYHLVNVFLQIASALLLWRILLSLRIPGAWLGAVLWALHPLQVESVAWITEMKNTQSCVFYLLTILFFVKWLEARMNDRADEWNYGLSLLFAFLAIASKFSTVVLPAVLCLAAWWMEGRWQWRNLVRVAPILVMSVVATGITLWLGIVAPAVPDGEAVRTWPERIAMSGDIFWFYAGKLLWPYPLMTIYPRWQIDGGQLASYLPLVVAVLLLSILGWKHKSWGRPYFFALAYFLVVLLPFLGFIDQSFWRYSFVEDHLQYLAGMGPMALAGAGLIRLADTPIASTRWWLPTLGVGILLILGTLTWQHALTYKSEETLWTDALSKNPDCWLGHNNLGVVLAKSGRMADGISHLREAVSIKPNYAQAHYNLGVIQDENGEIDDAMEHFQKALASLPDYAEAHNNLGITLNEKGRPNDAINEFRKAVASNPNYAEAFNNLGNVLSQTERWEEAVAQYQTALAIDPMYAEAHNNLGLVLFRAGRIDEAIAEFKQAVRVQPGLSDARNNLNKAQQATREKTFR